MNTIQKKMVLILFVSILSVNVNAQLKVEANGNVKIGLQSSFPTESKLEITGSNKTLEARIFPFSADIARLWTVNSIYAFAFGIDHNGYGHIYRNLNFPSTIMSFNSSGDFGIGKLPSYKLDVKGAIRVENAIFSDEHSKSNISSLTNKTNKLFNLKGVSYNINTPTSKSPDNIVQTQTLDTDKIFSEPELIDNRLHYGYIANEVKDVFPELIYEDNNGILGIDYISLIPLIIEELKQQNESIENLKNEIKSLKLILDAQKTKNK